MTRTRAPSSPVGAVLTLALAGGAALLIGVADAVGFRTQRAESLFTPAWVLGWALLVWAVIIGTVCVIHLGHRLLARRRRAPTPAGTGIRLLLLISSAVVITAVVWRHPWWGSGAGAG